MKKYYMKETDLRDAIVRASNGTIERETAMGLAKKFAPRYDIEKYPALGHKGVNWFAKLIVKKCQERCFYKVKSVVVKDRYKLHVCFENGDEKEYDVEPLFARFPAFKELKTPGLFERVTTDVGGYGVSWSGHIDLSCNELWHGGYEVKKV